MKKKPGLICRIREKKLIAKARKKTDEELLYEIDYMLLRLPTVLVDVDTIHRNLAILNERNPIELEDNSEEIWAKIMENHKAYLESQKK